MIEFVSLIQTPWPLISEVIIAPVSVHISTALAVAAPQIQIAAQNASAQGNGAFTGEVSADVLVDLGLKWVILGHSERRTLYGETNELLAKKLKYSLDKGLNVIFCIGEKLDEREAEKTNEVLETQLSAVKD